MHLGEGTHVQPCETTRQRAVQKHRKRSRSLEVVKKYKDERTFHGQADRQAGTQKDRLTSRRAHLLSLSASPCAHAQLNAPGLAHARLRTPALTR
eukprot:3018767-Pleurochrysis_carterae.AAC.3